MEHRGKDAPFLVIWRYKRRGQSYLDWHDNQMSFFKLSDAQGIMDELKGKFIGCDMEITVYKREIISEYERS